MRGILAIICLLLGVLIVGPGQGLAIKTESVGFNDLGNNSNRTSSIELGIYEICGSDSRCDPEEGVMDVKKMGADSVIVTAIENDVEKHKTLAYYDSRFVSLAGDSPQNYFNRTIAAAHANGMKVYALVNLPQEQWLADHPDWISVYMNGKPSDTYLDTYFYRIAPPSRVLVEPECLEEMEGIFDELASLGVDGIDINDNFEFPCWYITKNDTTLLSSYDDFTLARFERDTGRKVLGNTTVEKAKYISDHDEINYDWIVWRGKQVSNLLAEFQNMVTKAGKLEFRPHLLIGDWVYVSNGLDYYKIAENVETLYVMIANEVPIKDVPGFLKTCRETEPKKMSASVYLYDIGPKDGGKLEQKIDMVVAGGATTVNIFSYDDIQSKNLSSMITEVFSRVHAKYSKGRPTIGSFFYRFSGTKYGRQGKFLKIWQHRRFRSIPGDSCFTLGGVFQ